MMIGKNLMIETYPKVIWSKNNGKTKKNVQQINIQLDEKTSSGEYANFVVVTHSPAEFVLDFTRICQGFQKQKYIQEL